MIKHFIITSLLFIFSINIFSLDGLNKDKLLSKELFNSYKEDITLEQLNKVLEFDKNNQVALISKAIYLDKNNYDLNLVKKNLELSTLPTFESQLHYITTLYRLNMYEQVLGYTSKIDLGDIGRMDVLFYIADSYIRTGQNMDALKIIKSAQHQYPNEVKFYELEYLIKPLRINLTKVLNRETSLQSLIRLYQRCSGLVPKITIEVLLNKQLRKANINEINGLVGNYMVIPLLLKILPKEELSGFYYLDTNSDTYPDTQFCLQNGIIEYKKIDSNQDNIYELQFYFNDSIPYLIRYNESELYYDNYPFIDKILLSERPDYKKEYDLYKSYTKFKIPNPIINSKIKLDFSLLDRLKTISITTYHNNQLVDKKKFINDNTYFLLEEYNKYGGFDLSTYFEDNIKKYSLEDINSDGLFDIYKKFSDDLVIETKYNQENLENWWLK
ncbi:hypothetical protein EW093_16520 [Thiospirochaeta perfilievii]|uniref:Tetratricopeptide repeat protein n=1 Tax=Thiospirochaeta perfilievii TaxID=252967 RepID=A0A5C1QDS3_9SPIO|nr:hypothetical protein [Thiospirochaeta perfilievii]QEN06223.1 hypothetical protein EW093_16520 [Thiospirochaeta perfilievii]